LASDTPWAPAGHVVALVQHDRTPAARATVPAHASRRARRPQLARGALPAEFDERTGRLRRLFGLDVDGPRLELWRAPTDNDRGVAWNSTDGRSSESTWREHGLDRLVHRVRDVLRDGDDVVVRVRVGAAATTRCVDVTYRWELGDAVELRVEVVPSPDWDCTWPRVGVRFDLPTSLREARWFGTGPHESYPDSRRAARVGRFTAGLNELNVRYSRPQETGHRAELRELEVCDDARVRLRLRTLPGPSGHRPGFTLAPHTPQEVERARHPHELGSAEHTYLFLDDAVHGLGSAACGPDVLPQHTLWPEAREFGVVFDDPREP
jgi:beta-galactosidase